MKTIIKTTVILSLFLLISLISSSIWLKPESRLSQSEFGHLISLFNNNLNHLEVITDDNIQIEEVLLLWNGLEIFKNGKPIKNNIRIKRYIYGENVFIIKYKSKIIGEVIQYKFNNWSFHKYIFKINFSTDQVTSSLKIVGQDDQIKWIKDKR